MVWALPRSLAATYGIVITFSSSGYLDVSVRRVPSILLWIQSMVPVFLRRVSPFRYLRITACLRLPEAFRSLPRLSSAPSARASALRSCSLNHGCFRISPFLRYSVHSVTPLCISLFFSRPPRISPLQSLSALISLDICLLDQYSVFKVL